MKNPRILILIAFAALMLQNCSNENEETLSQAKTKMTFTLYNADLANGRKQSSDIKNVTSVSISITTATGEEVMTHQNINVSAFGDGFVTEPIELETGHYILTDFFLLGDSSTVLYATPHKGSFLGSLPKQPLDRNFSIAWNKTNTMAMEVVEVDGYTPEDFGYKSFSVEALKFFPLSVKINKQGKSVFTSAEAFLLQGIDTIGSYNIGTSPKLIKFNGDPNAEYDLVVIKDAFGRYTKHFKFNDLLVELNHRPLVVNLVPAFTMRTFYRRHRPGPVEYAFNFDLNTKVPSTFTINWGDGTEENGSSVAYFPDYISVTFNHIYDSDVSGHFDYFISITGPVDSIIEYYNGGNEFNLTMDVSALTELQIFNAYIGGPAFMDFRRNEKLEKILLTSDSVYLPKKNQIKEVILFPEMGNSIDYVVNNVYVNAVSKGIQNGRFEIANTAEGYMSDHPILATPNASSKIKLTALRDIYHWSIIPSL